MIKIINFVTRVATEQHFILKTVLFVPVIKDLYGELERLLQDEFFVQIAILEILNVNLEIL